MTAHKTTSKVFISNLKVGLKFSNDKTKFQELELEKLYFGSLGLPKYRQETNKSDRRGAGIYWSLQNAF